MMKWIFPLVTVAILFVIVDGKTTNNEKIKFGTFAPEASDWGEALKKMNADLMEKSNGQLQFQFHFNIDPKDLVNYMKSRRLDAIGLPVIGLQEILPETFIFQLPMLFSTYGELDYVRDRFTDYFIQAFNKKDYTFLAWADMGFTYIFSKTQIKTHTDLRKSRLWVWDIDPIAKEFASVSGIEPVLLQIKSVLPALKKGDVQTVYTPPYGCLIYQWQTMVKYMTNLPLSPGIGVTIMNKRRFDKLSVNHQRLLLETAKNYQDQLINKIRERNEKSRDELINLGIEEITVPDQERLKWKEIARRVQDRFARQLNKEDLLNEIKNLVEEYSKNR